MHHQLLIAQYATHQICLKYQQLKKLQRLVCLESLVLAMWVKLGNVITVAVGFKTFL